MEQRAHLYTLAGVCALPRAYLRTGNFPRAPIWRLCRNKGLHPLRRFAAIPAHPQKQYTRRWRLYHFCGFYYPIREVIPIAIYHWNIGIVSRGKGKSAVAAAHPGECRQTDADPDTGCMEFEIRKGRFSFRLTAPYSEERRKAASAAAKKCGVHRKVAAAGYTTD